jgi:hypothetical protein
MADLADDMDTQKKGGVAAPAARADRMTAAATAIMPQEMTNRLGDSGMPGSPLCRNWRAAGMPAVHRDALPDVY